MWLYDLLTPGVSPSLLPGDADIVFSPSGDVVYSGGRLWSVETGDLLAEVGRSTDSRGRGFLAEYGLFYVAALENGENVVGLWSIQGSGIHLQNLLHTGLNRNVYGVVFSLDGQFAAVGLYGTEQGSYSAAQQYQRTVVQLWNLASGQLVATLEQQMSGPYPMTFSNDGSLLLTSGSGESAASLLWDGRTGMPVPLPDALLYLDEAAFRPGDRLLAVDTGRGVWLWDGVSIGVLTAGSEYDYLPTTGVSFSPDGRILILEGNEAGDRGEAYSIPPTLALWDIDTARALGEPRLVLEHSSEITFSPDGTFFWANDAGPEPRLRVWDAETFQELTVLEGVWTAAGSPDGFLLATTDEHGSLRVWELPGLNERAVLVEGLTLGHLPRFSADRSRLLFPVSDEETRLWNLSGGNPESLPLPGSALLNAAFTRAVYWKDLTTVSIVDTTTGVETDLQVITNRLGSITAASLAGERVVFARDGRMIVYDLRTGWEIFTVEEEEQQYFEGPLVLSEGGSHVLLRAYEYHNIVSARLWSLPGSGDSPPQLEIETRQSVLNADGSLLAAAVRGWNEGWIQVWDLSASLVQGEGVSVGRINLGDFTYGHDLSLSRDGSHLLFYADLWYGSNDYYTFVTV